ncbi:MAG: lysostaphin resistance A-like protein [Planctomycetota bacterium]
MIQAAQEGIDSGTLAELGAVFAATSLALSPLAVFVVRRLFPGRNVFFARWGFSHVAILVALATVLFLALSFLDPQLESLAPSTKTIVELGLRTAVLGGCCAAVVVFARRLDPSGHLSLGLWPGRNLGAALAGLAGYGIVLPGILGLGLLWPWILRAFGAEIEPDPLLGQLRNLEAGERVIAILLAVAVAPLFEEMLFRAFLQPLLVQNLSDRLGIVVTSFVFAALHGATALVPIFALSLLLGAIMLRTQRLFAVWVVHATHNALVFLLLYA